MADSATGTVETHGSIVVHSGPRGVGKTTVAHPAAATFERSVHLKADEFMASVASGWVDPHRPDAEQQNRAIGAALAASAMSFAGSAYTTLLCGYLFPDGMARLAGAAARRGVSCHYAVLAADLATCWARASARVKGAWALEYEPFAAVHARFAQLDLDQRHVIDAVPSADTVAEPVLTTLRAGGLAITAPPTALGQTPS